MVYLEPFFLVKNRFFYASLYKKKSFFEEDKYRDTSTAPIVNSFVLSVN